MAGTGTLKYEVVEGWEQLPKGYATRRGGRGDGLEDRVYLFYRGDHPVIVYDRDGKFLDSWGEGEFTTAPRHHDRPGRRRLLRRRRQPHGPQVHPEGQAADDPRHA